MRGRALLIATSQYKDSRLSTLSSARIDAAGVREVLMDPHIGNFSTVECLNSPCQVWREEIDKFFTAAFRDELVLLYVSGHGIKGQNGKLYFAATDTDQDRLLATGIPSTLIHEAANGSRSRRVIMIFDTCFSGAFAKGWQVKCGPQSVNLGEYFERSTGRVVITASDAFQYALAGESQPSLFSKHLIEGLRTGEADLDHDGHVCSEELVRYVAGRMRRESAQQEPQRWAFDMKGDFIVASNPARARGRDTANYTRVIELPDASPGKVAGALVNRGIAKCRQGDTSGAIEDFTRAIELADVPSEQVALALVNRGKAKGLQGDRKGAIADYRSVIELSDAPSELVAQALLGTSG